MGAGIQIRFLQQHRAEVDVAMILTVFADQLPNFTGVKL